MSSYQAIMFGLRVLGCAGFSMIAILTLVQGFAAHHMQWDVLINNAFMATLSYEAARYYEKDKK